MAVQAALLQLPEDQRVAIVLVDLEGLSIDEAAAVLQIPGGTVKSRCFRGRARLAVSLGYLRNPDGPAPVTPGAPSGGHAPMGREGGRDV